MNHLKNFLITDFIIKNNKKLKVNNKNIKTDTAQGIYCPIIKTLDVCKKNL